MNPSLARSALVLGPALFEPNGAAALAWVAAGATVLAIVLFVALDLLDDLRRWWQERRYPKQSMTPGGLMLQEPDTALRHRHHGNVASAEGSWRGTGGREDPPPAR